MKTYKISCRKVKISISLQGGSFHFSARGERYVYLKKNSPRVEISPRLRVTCLLKYLLSANELFIKGSKKRKKFLLKSIITIKVNNKDTKMTSLMSSKCRLGRPSWSLEIYTFSSSVKFHTHGILPFSFRVLYLSLRYTYFWGIAQKIIEKYVDADTCTRSTKWYRRN